MNDAFGGLFSSRVNMNLREAKGWSYGASTFFLNGRGPRPWLIYAPVQTDKTRDSLVELRRELGDIGRARPVTTEEFEGARLQSVRALPGSFETTANVLDALAGAAASGRPLDWTATLADRYRAMTLADVQSAAGEIVHADDLVWVVVGDRAAIEADLRALDLAPIEIWDVNGRPSASGAQGRRRAPAGICPAASCYSAAEAPSSRAVGPNACRTRAPQTSTELRNCAAERWWKARRLLLLGPGDSCKASNT